MLVGRKKRLMGQVGGVKYCVGREEKGIKGEGRDDCVSNLAQGVWSLC